MSSLPEKYYEKHPTSVADQEPPEELVLKLGNYKRKPSKLTLPKRKKVLEYLLKEYNITRAAASVGCSRMAVVTLAERDPQFAEALQKVKDYHLDHCETAMFQLASVPSREGFQDRKLALQSHRRSIYGDKQEVAVDHQLTIHTMHHKVVEILQKNSLTEGEIDHKP